MLEKGQKDHMQAHLQSCLPEDCQTFAVLIPLQILSSLFHKPMSALLYFTLLSAYNRTSSPRAAALMRCVLFLCTMSPTELLPKRHTTKPDQDAYSFRKTSPKMLRLLMRLTMRILSFSKCAASLA